MTKSKNVKNVNLGICVPVIQTLRGKTANLFSWINVTMTLIQIIGKFK